MSLQLLEALCKIQMMVETSAHLNQLVTSFVSGLLKDEHLEGPDAQTRRILIPFIRRVNPTRKGESFPNFPTDSNTCPNCGIEVQDKRSPYCSEKCREMAAFVRQFRAAVSDGSILEPEKQAMMGQKLWAVAVGGYPMRQALVPPKVVAKVIERDGGKCQVCGAPATEIDHTGSG
ncbi:MAG: hypothetical protein KF784_00900 [Fimbriimonadaceae bacterium]|nr:hypothetical protein [Fimbriimonadaceae bacterium]